MSMHLIARTAVALAAASVLLALTGCSGPSQAAAPAPTATSKPTTYYGEAASAVAASVSGCTNVTALDVAQGPVSGLTSLASCVLDGRTVTFYGWTDPSKGGSIAETLAANADAEVWYANGDGWTAIVQYDNQLMYQLTNQADKLLADGFAGATRAPADIPGEKSAAEKVVAALGGNVAHYKP
ncbi:hypothetical protein [Arthrobacter dokdonensis]|uniref:hypothetical protein n=1 Tax=Arthrobacter dokdonellae TaxID=2211210 RepID=UPI000DE5A731|nr:hypothetical protein [Arthrobacter dokdonellae]